jgi:hypothetical protein
MTNQHLKVIAGIDTHADTHHVAIIDETGRHITDREFLAVGSGYRNIAAFITGFGPVIAAGVEGTGSYGAELARVLTGEGIRFWKSCARTGRDGGYGANRTLWTPTRPPKPRWPARM